MDTMFQNVSAMYPSISWKLIQCFKSLQLSIVGPHIATYDAYLRQVDPTGSGTVGAMEAATFMKKSGLKDAVLRQIWDLSDSGGKGFLNKEGFFVALKLIALAQSGREVSLTGLAAQVVPPNLGPPGSPALTSMAAADSIPWLINATEKAKYDLIFDGLQPMNGLLSGDKVKPVLLNSNLQRDVLGRVWDLSDVDSDGFLDREEFAVAMHLVYRALEKEPVPMALPPNLIPPGKRRKGPGGVVGAVPVLPSLGGPGSGRSSPAMGMGSPRRKTSLPGSGMTAWVVTPLEQEQYEEMFKVADLDKDGFVNGVEIKDVFLQSGVAQPVLAHIWNLCDTKGLGKLNSEQFCLAMYLIKMKLQGVDPPQQLTPEMLPPSMRAGGIMDGPLPMGLSNVVDSLGMKELDMISKEIDDLKKEKMRLEQDRAQKDADIKIRNGEVAALQKELDAINATVLQLETQKGEAQKRLDDLDDKRSKFESTVTELREKCEEEQRQIASLRVQLANSESTVKNQEEELHRVKDELGTLRMQEVELEQKVEAGQTQLEQLNRTISDSQAKISQAKKRIVQLTDSHASINKSIAQYTALLNGEEGAVEPSEPTLSTTPSFGDEFSSRATVGSSPVSISSMSAHSSLSGFDDNREDPFKGKDPFANANGDASDPFKEDPFKNSGADDPFKDGDPFKASFGAPDPFGGADPFKANFDEKGGGGSLDAFGGSKDAFGSSAKDSFGGSAFKEDPFKDEADPFASAFSSGPSAAKNDPFDPFGGSGSRVLDLKSPANKSDPFGTDPFAPGDPRSTASPTPALPPKQKKPAPPRPPAPKKSPQLPRSNDALSDPFGDKDPFGSSGQDGGDSFANFADFSPSKFGSPEEAQLAWATQESNQEVERRRRMEEQEQADLELAIALSKAEMQQSEA